MCVCMFPMDSKMPGAILMIFSSNLQISPACDPVNFGMNAGKTAVTASLK